MHCFWSEFRAHCQRIRPRKGPQRSPPLAGLFRGPFWGRIRWLWAQSPSTSYVHLSAFFCACAGARGARPGILIQIIKNGRARSAPRFSRTLRFRDIASGRFSAGSDPGDPPLRSPGRAPHISLDDKSGQRAKNPARLPSGIQHRIEDFTCSGFVAASTRA